MARIGSRDLEITRFVGRTKIVRPEHVALRFDVTERTAYRRLSALAEAGLLEAVDLSLKSRVWYATQAGLKISGLDLPVASPSLYAISHDLAATQLVALLESKFVDTVTEREMRSHERAFEDGRYLFDVEDKTAGKRIRHLADVACELEGHDRFFLIEVELTRKRAQRWRDTLAGFARRLDVAGFAGVLYLVADDARPSHIARLADEAGLGSRCQVQAVSEADPLAALLALANAIS